MAIPASCSFFPCRAPFGRARHICSRPPLGGCSFDLGSCGSGQGKAAAVAEKPTDNISARSINDAQGYATRGQVLARSGKTEEALAEFDRALALDPYNVQALYGRGLIYQGEKQHQQAIEDFTAANGLTPQKRRAVARRARPATSRSTRPRKRPPISTRRCRPTRTTRQPGQPAAWPMSGSATRPRRPLPMAARSRSVPRTKPRAAASRVPAARFQIICGNGYFGSTAWNIDFAADNTSSATRRMLPRRRLGSPRRAGRAGG